MFSLYNRIQNPQQKHIFVVIYEVQTKSIVENFVVNFVQNSHTTMEIHFHCCIRSVYQILNGIMILCTKSETKTYFC